MESESNPHTPVAITPPDGESRPETAQTTNHVSSTASLPLPDDSDDDDQDLIEHNNTLESTNKLLHDLERKLAPFSPTASVSSSQYTQTDSVVHNPNHAGLGKSTISSSVLQYIINNDDDDEEDATKRIHNNIFDPNELFNERNNKFMTKFGKGYNDDKVHQQRKLTRKNSLKVNQDRLVKKSSDASLNGHIVNDNTSVRSMEAIHVDNIDDDEDEDEDYISESNNDDDDDDYDDSDLDSRNDEDTEDFEPSTPELNIEKLIDEDIETEQGDEEENLEDLYLPPSPPRSPPREIDPNKLYGLYDFSGPDPSHCTLQRDEPVHLINDEDNYWWLIRKLTKQERIERGLQEKGEDQEVVTDEEDGKVGFVPAECLETYGERLARLNCFKNEELEKKELPLESVEGGETEEGDNSVDSLSSRQNKKCNKSVTFESLGEITDDDDDEENEEDTLRRPPGFGYFIHDKITQDEDKSDEKQSEILSDIFPETPLNLPKHKRSSDKKPDKLNIADDAFEELFIQPKRASLNTLDEISIGSYSPDTPSKKEEPEEDDNSSLTRSIILDRLRKVTSDIQEQMDQTDTRSKEHIPEVEPRKEPIYSENPYQRTARQYSGTSPEYTQPDSDNNTSILEEPHDGGDEQLSPNLQSLPTPENSSSHLSLHKSKKESIDATTSSSLEDLIITPSTSVNSSSNDIKNERRKSKPVHEMFMPILGKFDELAEKLAELDDILNS
ncbi:uncharacterized protein SPAPADRAFT_66281 [Spathaspora passalidarum NRRL Y-27907]|uniref:SH3 domain-containing protein n=1 Tax=Spathaspora passalidarum (strain NRRL Y-27907 / 11-Y1) TaxID=619300 RepID=G3ALR0_SPAPN|nr:uncharacterized protein SPAPADRAFT_66281 [Spathaspora passalidarum NRRL Y-27907]EGW33303.1 hypothetical protein SPAPADRAFT_66281 [Spathaspora passalidarum NRRL Y-27907]